MGVREDEKWENGTPLDDAWLEFIDVDAPGWGRRENYKAILRPAREGTSAGNPGLPWTTFEPKEAEFREAKRRHWERSYKNELLSALRQELLLAYGKPWLPERSEDVVLVPSSLFDTDATPPPDIEWKTGFVSARGRAYDSIRIVEPPAAASIEQTSTRRGPKSQKPEIEEIVRDFVSENRAWLKLPFNERSTQIILEAKKRNKSLSGNPPKGFGRTVIDEVCKKIVQ